MSPRGFVIALVTGAVLALPAAAPAATTTVNFSEFGLSDGTTVLDQYAGSPYFVRFGNPTKFGFPAPPPLLNCGFPYSQSNALNGTALGIACLSGSNEFPDRRFATAMEFQNEQRAISFKIVNRTPHQQTAVTKFYGIGSSSPFTTLTHVLPPNVTATVSYDRGSNQIVGAVVQGLEAMEYGDSGGVFVDDLAMTRDAEPLTPKFSVALQQPSAEVVEGSSVDVPVSVRRYNGSTGAVSLSVGTLPSKIASTQFLPNASVTGSDPATLRITSKLSNVETSQLLVSASGGGSAGTGVGVTDLSQSVTGLPAVYFATGGRFPIRLVPGCGPQKITDSFNVRGGFSGYTDYNFAGTAATSGLVSMTTGSSVFPSGNGTYPIEYTLDPGGNPAGSGNFKVEMHPLFATPAPITLTWLADPLTISQVPNRTPALPLQANGTTIRVLGNFPSNCPVTFQDSLNQVWPIKSRDQTEVDGRLLDDYTLTLPATAVSGPLRALNGAGSEIARTPDIDVREFRRTYGFNISNSTPGGATGTYSWADFERTFGTDDTDACFVVCVHDPIASDYFDQFKATVQAGTGLCFGYAVMAARFRGYVPRLNFGDYQRGATRAWDINPVLDGTAVKRDIVRWFVAQNDKTFQDYRSRAASRSPADEKRLLKDLINQQGSALIGIRQGASGHAVTAYAATDTPTGGLTLFTYDSNIPYQQFEQTNATTRTNALTNSQITIQANGAWSGTGSVNWSGPNATLMVLENLPPPDAKLPSDFSLASVFGSSRAAGPARITAIEAGGKPQLDSDGEPVDGGSVDLLPDFSGNGAVPQYELQKGREFEFTIRGTRKGSYDQSLLTGSKTASVRGADTKTGQIDHVIVRPGEASLRFATGAARAGVTYDLKDQRGKVTRTAQIAMTAKEGGEDETELSGGTLRIAHDGAPAAATVTLGAVGAGLPGSVRTAPMRIGRGQRLELKPRSWGALSSGVRYALKTKSGRVLRSGTARLRAGGRVAISGVKATRKGKKLTVSGRVVKRGSEPDLAAVATVVRGGRTIRRKTARLTGGKVKKGRFALAITIGSVPRGARVKVDVVLVDQTGTFASARKSVRAR